MSRKPVHLLPINRDDDEMTREEYEKKRKAAQRTGIIRSLVMLAGLIALAVWMGIRGRGPQVESVTPAQALDDAYRPVEATDTFGPTDTFFVAVQISNYEPSMNVTATWRYEGDVITTTPLSTDTSGEGFAGFSLSPSDPPQWPSGSYNIEIFYNDDMPLGSAEWTVEE